MVMVFIRDRRCSVSHDMGVGVVYYSISMNRDELTRKLEYMEMAPLEAVQQLVRDIIERAGSTPEDLGATNWALLKITEVVTRTKEVEIRDKLQHYEALLRHVVSTSIKHDLVVGFDSLRLIFDHLAEFYKHNLHDKSVEFPLTRERPIQLYFPAVGEECDVVRPSLTTTSRMGWTRCKVLAINNSGVYTVRFHNTFQTTVLTEGSWFAPLSTRTQDFAWRNNLKDGDLVDACDNKSVWLLSTIAERSTDEQDTKSVRVTFREFSPKGDREDSEGNRFFGWGSNEDEWMDITNPRIQRPNKMRRDLCYYASTPHNEFYVEDSYDIVYEKEFAEKPFYAMLRSSFTRSQAIYSLFNFFVQEGGMQKVLSNVRESKNVDSVCNLAVTMGMVSFMPPRMGVTQLFSEYLACLVEFVQNNPKAMNNLRLDMVFWGLEYIGKRILTLCQKHDMIEGLKRFLIPRFLTANLEKQLIGLRYLYDLIKPMRPLTEETEKELQTFIRDNNIFYLMYQPNETHQQILNKSTNFLEYLLKNNLILVKELDYLWNLFPLNDVKGRVTLQKLIGDVIHEMGGEQITYLLDRLLEVKPSDLTMDHLQLLHSLKYKNKLEGHNYVRALDLLWQLLTTKSATVKPSVEQEVQRIFKSFISNIQDESVKFQLLNSMINCLRHATTVQREPSFLRQFILTYKSEGETDAFPTTRSSVIAYLCKENIYSILLKLLISTKAENRIQDILNLLSDLLKNDQQNELSPIAKEVYKILGPSEVMLKWMSQLNSYLSPMIEELFVQTQDLSPFENISLSSLNAITSMFNDLNSLYGKRRYVKEKLEIDNIGEVEWNSFVYTTCNPKELMGLHFMESLLVTVKNTLVYTKIIEFIVKLYVNLDEQLSEQSQQVRGEFIKGILEEFERINNEPEFNDSIKQRLNQSLNMVTELMEQAEVEGLRGIVPHFQTLIGESINLKIENAVAGSKKHKEVELFVNTNITLESLKAQIADKLEESVLEISLLKGKRIYEDKLSGKSLLELRITKGDVIRVEKSRIPQALKAPLLTDDKADLSPKMKAVSHRIYSIYADLENATILSKANFMKLSAEISKANGREEEAKKLMEKDNQENKNIKCTQHELDSFFVDLIKQMQHAVWKFVESLGLQQDLKAEAKDGVKRTPIEALPRFILAEQGIYSTLLSMLKNPKLEPLHLDLYKLLCSLPTYERLRQMIFGVWDSNAFNRRNSTYEVDYLLGLLEVELERNEEFTINFAKSGLKTLVQYVQQYNLNDKANSVYSLNSMERVVISSIVRIFTGFIRISFQPNSLSTRLYYEKVNELELSVFIEIVNRKVDLNQHDIEFNDKLINAGIVVPKEAIAQQISGIFGNLISNYTQHYIKELTPEIARISAILTSHFPQPVRSLLEGIKVDSINLRRTSANLLYLQASLSNDLLGEILQEMLRAIPNENKSNSIQYFELLSKLISLSIEKKANTVDLKALAEELLNRVLIYNSDEKRGSIVVDRIISGLLSVIESILATQSEVCASLNGYKWKLLTRCLFYPDPSDKMRETPIPTDVINNPSQPEFFQDYINCKSGQTRKQLINVIILLAKYGDNQEDFLEAMLEPLLKQLPEKHKKPNSKTHMVGMMNLGGICYLNSMFQSLNSISAFRNGLSMVEKEDSKLITSTQKMLAYLLFSQRQDFVPSPFLEAFREPINPNVQQDTTEFLNMYFDELERELQTTPYRHLLKQLFQGSTVVQMICHNCKNKRERKEEYYCYSVGVRDKPTLEVALEGMHEGDIINDYSCEACGVKSDLTKRSVLGDLPNFMFLHLQRIVNLDFYRYTKIHSKCLFPLELNLEPFTKEGIELRESVGVEYLKKLHQNQEESRKFEELAKHGKPEKSYQYNLKAIIVHSGSAEGGHYYVIMKRESGGWVKLDDSKITLFSLEQFQSECYGGPFQVIGEWGIEESKNAYVLLYEKELKSGIRIDFEDSPQELTKFNVDIESQSESMDYSKFKSYNTPHLYKQVWMDNHRLMLESHIFAEGYSRDFIRLVESLLQFSKSNRKAELISEVLLKVSCWSNEVGGLMDQFVQTNPGYDIFLKYCKDFENMINLIFHGERNLRVAACKFLSTLVLNSCKEGPAPEVFRLLDFFLSKLNHEVAKNWLRVESYFNFLYQIAVKSVDCPVLYEYLINQHLIAMLVDFILEKESPLKLGPKKHSMGNKFNNVDFSSGVKIIHWVLQRSFFFNGRSQIDPQEAFHLSNQDILALSCMGFYAKMIKENQAVSEMAQIITKLAVENQGFVEAIARTLLRVLNDSMEKIEETKAATFCIEKVMLLEDSLWAKKAEMILGIGQPYQVSKDRTFCALDMDRFSYNSTLEDSFPIECLLNLCWISRQRYPLSTLYMINTLLSIALMSEEATQYVGIQPPPIYLFNRFYDWFDDFIQFAAGTIIKDKNKEQEINKLIVEIKERYSLFKARADSLPVSSVITGKIFSSKIQTIKHKEIGVSLLIQDFVVFSIPSLPSDNHQQNAALSKYLTNHRLEDKNESIEAESSILKFMSTSQPLLAITQDKLETYSNKAENSEVRDSDPDFIGPLNFPVVHYDSYIGNIKPSTDPQKGSSMDQEFLEEAPNRTPSNDPKEHGRQENPTNIKEENMEIEYRRVDIDQEITKTEYFREVSVKNHTDQNLWVKLTIDGVDYLEYNFLLPHLASSSVLPHKSQILVSLYKLDISRPFLNFNYHLSVKQTNKRKKKENTPAFFKAYGEQQDEPTSAMQVQDIPLTPETPASQMQEDTIKNCLICTLSNPIDAQKCEMCDSAFV